MQVFFKQFSKKQNSTKQPGDMAVSLECKLKEPSSVMSPSLEISNFNSALNYCYINDFGRYYWVNNVTRLTATLSQVDLSCDVLATYKPYISKTTAFVEFCRSGNSMIPDSRLSMTSASTVNATRYEMPGFSTSPGTYIITVVAENADGVNGFATSYSTTSTGIASLASRFNTTNLIEDLKEQFTNPIAAVVKCVWLPLRPAEVANGQTTIKIGSYETGLAGWYVKQLIRGEISIEIPYLYAGDPTLSDYPYADYRNIEPYTECTMFLPGIGCVQIPLQKLIKQGQTNRCFLQYTIDPANGDIVYILTSDILYDTVLTLTGNIAVELPVSALTTNAIGRLQDMVGGIGHTVMTGIGFATGNYGMAIKQAGSALVSAGGMYVKPDIAQTSITGNIGGRAGSPYTEYYEIQMRYNVLSGAPSPLLGMPTYSTKTIGSLPSGYVKCMGATVDAPATEAELDKINSYINGGFYYE